jgi:hypothetical protein
MIFSYSSCLAWNEIFPSLTKSTVYDIFSNSNKTGFRPVSWEQQGYYFMLNAEEILCRLFPALLTTLDVLWQHSAIFVFVLFAMQYKVCLGSTKRYHLVKTIPS